MNGNNDTPAFPRAASENTEQGTPCVTLRDWFAGQALSGLIASFSYDIPVPKCDETAESAYAFADAMLAERGKRPE